jgi:hypothetical protein
MSIIHTLAAFSEGGVSGLQSTQSDWSPYVAHFTSSDAMQPIRDALEGPISPEDIRWLLRRADEESFRIVEAIAGSARLIARTPASKDGIPPCICLSECVIGGLISNAERYGRFGLVFDKTQLFPIGGGPCLYINAEEYTEVVLAFKQSSNPIHRRIFGRANFMNPAGVGGKIQDYSHEREWRVFSDIDLTTTPPQYLLAPRSCVLSLRNLFPSVASIIPIDTMFEWGA